MGNINSNEITVKVNVSIKEMEKILIDKGFKLSDKFTCEDNYFIPKDMDIKSETIREIIKKAIGIIILCITIPMGLIAMCYGQIISSIIALIINTHYTGKLIEMGFINQIKDLIPIFILTITMWLIIYFGILPIIENNLLKLTISIITGLTYYIGIAWIFKFPELKELLTILNKK